MTKIASRGGGPALSDPDWVVIIIVHVFHAQQRLLFLSIRFCNSGLEKSAAIRPFATKKSRLASEKILLADSLAIESCRLADRLATKLFSKRTTPMRTERDRARSLANVFVGPEMQRELAVRGRRSCLRVKLVSKPTPGV